MRRLVWLGALACILLAGCSLATSGEATPAGVPTSTLLTAPAVTPTPAATSPLAFPTLESSSAPYPNLTYLLDGVCFEFLLTLSGETWVWQSADDLAAFYNRVDASEQCGAPVERPEFTWPEGEVLAGTVNAAAGCDAAHRVVDLTRDVSAGVETLVIAFAVQPGCAYELVQPFVVAVPRPPDAVTLRLVLTSGP
ncbi:MAG: hypothetical protein GX573_22125 [Chloroflexi bacterium]|nr:hypothetical protein [Chloroflexota bacterium]